MTTSTRIGLAFSQSDLAKLREQQLDLVWIPAGVALSEQEVSAAVGCRAKNLNRYMKRGSIVQASRAISPLIRSFISANPSAPIEAIASQNDVYQYHLRHQYYFLASLETALKSIPDATLVIVTRPYTSYWSPMRPDMGKLHDVRRLDAYLAIELCNQIQVQVEFPRSLVRSIDVAQLAIRRAVRRSALTIFRFIRLFEKCWHARRDAVSCEFLTKAEILKQNKPVGIVVRTDSEVVSASYLCRELSRRKIPFVLIRDELLSSQTTGDRLRKLNLPYVSIGSVSGTWGLIRVLLTAPRSMGKASLDVGVESTCTASAVRVLASNEVWVAMSSRMMDFCPDQRHFANELSSLITAFGVSALVTYAYVDQWGPIIREVGACYGLKTIAIQNAAQDPEEYPRLAWSDHYCVESIYFKRTLIDLGYPEGRLTGTGLPHFAGDMPTEIRNATERQALRSIVVLTQPIYAPYFEAIIRECANVAAKNGMRLIVKYHPRQSNLDYASAIAYARSVADLVLVQSEPLDQVLDEATVCVSVVSAALFRAVFLGVPSFSLLPVEEHHLDLSYVNHPVMKTVSSVDELGESIQRFIANIKVDFDSYILSRIAYLKEQASFEPTTDSQENIAGIVIGARNVGER